jgi:hypothetical protein
MENYEHATQIKQRLLDVSEESPSTTAAAKA